MGRRYALRSSIIPEITPASEPPASPLKRPLIFRSLVCQVGACAINTGGYPMGRELPGGVKSQLYLDLRRPRTGLRRPDIGQRRIEGFGRRGFLAGAAEFYRSKLTR